MKHFWKIFAVVGSLAYAYFFLLRLNIQDNGDAPPFIFFLITPIFPTAKVLLIFYLLNRFAITPFIKYFKECEKEKHPDID